MRYTIFFSNQGHGRLSFSPVSRSTMTVPLFLVLCFFFFSFAFMSFKQLIYFDFLFFLLFFFWQTIALIAVREGVVQLGSMKKVNCPFLINNLIPSPTKLPLHIFLINWSHLIRHQIFSSPHACIISLYKHERDQRHIHASCYLFIYIFLPFLFSCDTFLLRVL